MTTLTDAKFHLEHDTTQLHGEVARTLAMISQAESLERIAVALEKLAGCVVPTKHGDQLDIQRGR